MVMTGSGVRFTSAAPCFSITYNSNNATCFYSNNAIITVVQRTRIETAASIAMVLEINLSDLFDLPLFDKKSKKKSEAIKEYVSIHPFQDGNGRTSRLLTNLMLLQSGYEFISIVSHERAIESKKADYYLALNKAKSSWKTKKEDISPWVLYFLNIIREQARQALKILKGDDIDYLLSEKQLALWQWINQRSEKTFSRKDAIQAINFPPRTIEACIKKLLDLKKITKLGEGRATRYRLEK